MLQDMLPVICRFMTDIWTLNNITTTITTILWPFFRDNPSELMPEENLWTLWCKGRLTEADTDQLAGRHSIWTNQCPPPPHINIKQY